MLDLYFINKSFPPKNVVCVRAQIYKSRTEKKQEKSSLFFFSRKINGTNCEEMQIMCTSNKFKYLIDNLFIL